MKNWKFVKRLPFWGLIPFLAALCFYCSKPTEPEPFLELKLETADINSADSATYVGVPVRAVAMFDTAIPFGSISWISTSGTAEFERSALSSTDTTSSDTVYITWTQLPMPAYVVVDSGDSGSSPTKKEVYIDSIYVMFDHAASNMIRVEIKNRVPVIDSITVNSYRAVVREDSITLAGNHSTQMDIKVYVSDPDIGSMVTLNWQAAGDALGTLLSKEKDDQAAGHVWNLKWRSPDVTEVGDSTYQTTALIRIADSKGGMAERPVRIIVYRETGSVWVASTHEVGADTLSSLIKYSNDGREVLRIPGFQMINSLAVNNATEEVWFTDAKANKIYCYDDDGNQILSIDGFTRPVDISVKNSDVDVCYVVDNPPSSTGVNRIRKISNGTVDSLSLSYTAEVSDLAIDQVQNDEFWYLFIGLDSYDNHSLRKVVRRSGSYAANTVLDSLVGPKSLAINSVVRWIWIAETENNKVLRFSIQDSSAIRIDGFRRPQMVAVNEKDTSCWVADTDNDRIVQLRANINAWYDVENDEDRDTIITTAFDVNFKQPGAIAVNPNEGDGVVWVVDTQNNRIVKLSAAGVPVLQITEFGMESPKYIAVNKGSN